MHTMRFLGAASLLLLGCSCASAILTLSDCLPSDRDGFDCMRADFSEFSNVPSTATVYWTLTEDQETLRLLIRAPTTGWVGLGWSPNLEMVGSMVFIGWITSEGTVFFDQHMLFARNVPGVVATPDLFEVTELPTVVESDGFTEMMYGVPAANHVGVQNMALAIGPFDFLIYHSIGRTPFTQTFLEEAALPMPPLQEVIPAECEDIPAGCAELNIIIAEEGTSQPIMGTSGCDCIVGTTGPDTIFGLAGSDIIVGSNGNDIIYGGNGKDTVFGGKGNDKIFGGTGNDSLYGELGLDILFGGKGNDYLSAGATGKDKLFGGNGFDTLVAGGSDPDTLLGGKGKDKLIVPGKACFFHQSDFSNNDQGIFSEAAGKFLNCS